MSTNLEQKKVVVSEIKEKIQASKSFIVIDYRGLTVAEVTELRNQFRKANVEYSVLKNTLVRRAAQECGIVGLEKYLEGPSAFAFGMTDPVAPAKVITEYIKKTKKTEVKAGVIDNMVIDAAGVTALSELPPKEVLISRIMGSLNAPISNFVGVLSATLRSLVYAIDAVRKQKDVEVQE